MSYLEMNQVVFEFKTIKRVKSRDEGVNMCDLNLKRILHLFFVHDEFLKLLLHCNPVTGALPTIWKTWRKMYKEILREQDLSGKPYRH